MKQIFILFMAVLALAMTTGCKPDAPEEPTGPEVPENPDVPNEPKTVNFTLTECAMTTFEAGGDYGMDSYIFMLSTGELYFDETVGQYASVEPGYVVVVNLLADVVTPPALSSGTYVLGEDVVLGTWFAPNSFIVVHDEDGNISRSSFETGTVNVATEGGDTEVVMEFTLSGEISYKGVYDGLLEFDDPNSDDVGKITKPVNAELVGGNVIYWGDRDGTGLGVVRFELYDSEPDPEIGTVFGNLIKCEMYIPLHDYSQGDFTIPTGTFEFSDTVMEYGLIPGYDDGINIPTGCYISQRTAEDWRLGVLVDGMLDVMDGSNLILTMTTDNGVSVQAVLSSIPLDIVDYSGGGNGGGNETPQGPYSTLTEDKVVDLQSAICIAGDYGDYYENGTRNVVIQLKSETNQEVVLFDFVMPGAEINSPLSPGVYTMDADGSHAAFTYAPSSMNVISEEIFNLYGTWGYAGYIVSEEYSFDLFDPTRMAPVTEGTVTISVEGDMTTISYDFLDDAPTPNRVSGTWTGTVTF